MAKDKGKKGKRRGDDALAGAVAGSLTAEAQAAANAAALEKNGSPSVQVASRGMDGSAIEAVARPADHADPTPTTRPASKPVVGREIRRWRRTRSMTLAMVAERSGLNVGYLSQIENEKAVPSLDALVAIANALDVPPAWLLLDSSPPPVVVRLASRPTVRIDGPGRATEVDGGTGRDLGIIEVVVPPGRAVAIDGQTGDEHYLVIDGRLRMVQGDHEVELGPGDYLAWDPSLPHEVANVGDSPGRLLLIRPRHSRRADPEARS